VKIGRTFDMHLHERDSRIKIINECMPSEGLVLDVGPGIGTYDSRNCSVISIDINPAQIPTIIADVQQLPLKNNVFDLVIATEIIEHVDSPKSMLVELKRVCKLSGKVLISTPNVAHFTNRIALMFFGDFCDDKVLHSDFSKGRYHIHFFSRKYFLHILQENNFVKIKEWNRFIPITRKYYITGKYIDTVFKNFAKQTIVLCKLKS
jgi:2-polyprenyl-3-methyl-5-hydroxy-6-metoxy-1,4-benzoquinol methylase